MSPAVEHEIVTALRALSQALRCFTMGESVGIADGFIDVAEQAIANVTELAANVVELDSDDIDGADERDRLQRLRRATFGAGGSSEPGGER